MTQIDATTGFPGFTTSFSRFLGTDGVTNLQVTASYISSVDTSCSATYVTEVCDIRLGVNTYPLIYANNSYTLDSLEFSETLVSTYTTTDDLPDAPFESPAGLLSGLHWFADTYLASNSTIVHGTDPSGNDMYIEIPSGYLSSNHLNLTNEFSATVNCQFEYSSPTVQINDALNAVAFNAAQIAGMKGNAADLQTFPVLQTSPTIVYHSQYSFLAIGVVLMLLALVAVTFTLYGFWQIGHDTSLSPLETARALHAPILADGTNSSDLKGLVKEVGSKDVKYGVLAASGSHGGEVYKLGIGHPHMLVRHFTK